MSLEYILWEALKIVVSLFVGWILGNLYAISLMKSKREQQKKKSNIGDYLPDFLRRKDLQENIKKPEFEIATSGDPRKT